MSIIFQLFRADDLKMLCMDQLGELKEKINDALKKAQQEFQSSTGNPENSSQQQSSSAETPPEPLRLNIIHKPDPSSNTPQQLRRSLDSALDRRFYEVSQQLKSAQPPPASNFDARLSRIHLNQSDAEEPEKEKLILAWAMSCEVNNFEFYYPLWYAKKAAYDFFYEKTGQVPKGPDSLYSPLNPVHPYANFFYGLPSAYTEPEVDSPQGAD